VQTNLATLASVVAAKVSVSELQNGLLSLNLAGVTTSGELRASSLDISGTTVANQIIASTIDAINVTASIGSFGKFSSERIFDNGSTLYLAYSDDPFAIRFGNGSARVGINCDNSSTSGVALDCAGGARFSGPVAAGATVINSGAEDIPFIVGNDDSYLRVKFGRHLDSYGRDGAGRDLNMCVHTGNAVRIGSKLAIGQTPNNFQFSCNGAGQFTSFCDSFKFNTTSDRRIKSNIEQASLDECSRLVQAVRPMTFTRNDKGGEAYCGYVAQDWQAELKDGFRNTIMGESEDAEGPLLSLDHSKICVILHGALLSALARIDALESRL
jgi:hypothetical protein